MLKDSECSDLGQTYEDDGPPEVHMVARIKRDGTSAATGIYFDNGEEHLVYLPARNNQTDGYHRRRTGY